MINIGSTKDFTSALTVYPGLGYPIDGGRLCLQIAGLAWQSPVVISMRQRMMIRVLGGVMNATPDDLSGEMFQSRIKPFMAEANHRQIIVVKIGSQTYRLKKRTKRNGHFHESLTIAADKIEPLVEEVVGRRLLRLTVEIQGSSEAPVDGVAYLYPANGVSVVSDIDDTIKDSSVGDKRELLANTFLRKFRSIEGMVELYQQWADQGAGFHYVSSSPWQLFQSLQDLQTVHGFPLGTVHLRNFRLRDQLLKRVIVRRQGKAVAIARLLKSMPSREMVLVGDSGEKDPKIYRKICRKFPGRIRAVFIRDLEHRPFDDEQLKKLQSSVGDGICAKFKTAAELKRLSASLFDRAAV